MQEKMIVQEKEKENGRNSVDSAILLSDLLIKLETDLEENKSEIESKLERKR